MPDLTPLSAEERCDLIRCAEQWCDGQLDAPISRIGVGRETFRWEATVAAAEQEVAALREALMAIPVILKGETSERAQRATLFAQSNARARGLVEPAGGEA